MTSMRAIPVLARSTAGFSGVLSEPDARGLDDALAELRAVLGERRVWHVNTTAASGGVAELLGALLPYVRGAGVDVRWVVLEGPPEFFTLTKRLHHRLHESPGDGGPLDDDARALYGAVTAHEEGALLDAVRPGDVVVLHDPQTAGLAPGLVAAGACVLWRCHVGVDVPGPCAREAWEFLRPHVAAARTAVFTRHAYVWEGLPAERVAVIPPCIDVLAPKNRPLLPDVVAAVLHASRVVPWPGPTAPGFTRRDGSLGVVTRSARRIQDGPVPAAAPLVVQVSRWDRLKDPAGLVAAFAAAGLAERVGAHLVLAGPETDSVDDDPEQAAVLAEVEAVRAGLAPGDRRAVHLVCLPMDDLDENAVIVNALQRRADVIVQKSLVEGFGLTVTEAMWKARPVVAGRVGGIQDQIGDGESGVLVDDPADDGAFGRAVADLLADRRARDRLGRAAHQRVCEAYVPTHHFRSEAALLTGVLDH
jgi:trehalose synthase